MNHHEVATDLMRRLKIGAGPQEGVIHTYQSKTIPIGKRETIFILDVYDLGAGAMALALTVESGASVNAMVVHRHMYFAGARMGPGDMVAADLDLMNSHHPLIPNAVVDVSDLVIDGQNQRDIAVVTKLSYIIRQISMAKMAACFIVPGGLPDLNEVTPGSAVFYDLLDDFYCMSAFADLWQILCQDMVDNLTLHLLVCGSGLR